MKKAGHQNTHTHTPQRAGSSVRDTASGSSALKEIQYLRNGATEEGWEQGNVSGSQWTTEGPEDLHSTCWREETTEHDFGSSRQLLFRSLAEERLGWHFLDKQGLDLVGSHSQVTGKMLARRGMGGWGRGRMKKREFSSDSQAFSNTLSTGYQAVRPWW